MIFISSPLRFIVDINFSWYTGSFYSPLIKVYYSTGYKKYYCFLIRISPARDSTNLQWDNWWFLYLHLYDSLSVNTSLDTLAHSIRHLEKCITLRYIKSITASYLGFRRPEIVQTYNEIIGDFYIFTFTIHCLSILLLIHWLILFATYKISFYNLHNIHRCFSL